jgi:hypothetical protein
VLAGIPQRSLRNSSRIGNGGRRLLAGFVEILRNFSGFAAQHLRDTKPQKFVAYQEGGLKPAAGRMPAPPGFSTSCDKWPKPRGGLKGRLQARLPATRKADLQNRGRALIASSKTTEWSGQDLTAQILGWQVGDADFCSACQALQLQLPAP